MQDYIETEIKKD